MEPISSRPFDDFPVRIFLLPGGVGDKCGKRIIKEGIGALYNRRSLIHNICERGGIKMRNDWVYRRGDIYLADLSPVKGSEQGGLRPVVVIQNNIGNFYSPTLIVAMITAKNKISQPTHYRIEKNSALLYPSTVLLEQLRSIDKQRIKRYLGKVSRAEMEGIDSALLVSLEQKKNVRG